MTTETTASESMPTFYATFDVHHTYAGHHVEIVAEDKHIAAWCMVHNHGRQWSGRVLSQDGFRDYQRRNKSKRLARITQRAGAMLSDGSPVFQADRRS